MCLLFCCRNIFPDHPLVILANRDEYYRRPTAAAEFWKDAPSLLAGRDLESHGTWFGVSRDGRWAALTNFREMTPNRSAQSRGELPTMYLQWNGDAEAFIDHLIGIAGDYNGFNLLFGNSGQAWWFSNRGPGPMALGDGVFGLSNELLDVSWPKVEEGKKRIADLLSEYPVPDLLFGLLMDQSVYPDHQLPQTGIDMGFERLLSSAFIRGEDYGTRSSTILIVDREKRALFEEHTYTQTADGRSDPAQFRSAGFYFRLN